MEGFLEIVDPTGRASRRLYFKNIAPQFCDMATADKSLMLHTDKSSVLEIVGVFFGDRTNVTVDGLPCLFTMPPPLCTGCSVSDLAPCTEALKNASSPDPPKAIACYPPTGYGLNRAVVVYNGDQPSLSSPISFKPPVITSLSATVFPTSGVDVKTGRRVVLEILGSEFSDWDAIDAQCRDNDTMTADRCDSSVVCALVGTQCQARCRTPACVWTSGDATPRSFAPPTPLSGIHPLGTVSLQRNGVVNYMRVLSWTHNRIRAEVPEGVGAGYSVVVNVSVTAAAWGVCVCSSICRSVTAATVCRSGGNVCVVPPPSTTPVHT